MQLAAHREQSAGRLRLASRQHGRARGICRQRGGVSLAGVGEEARGAAEQERVSRRPCRQLLRQAENDGEGLAFYRKYTTAMLRKYLRVSMEVGRVPSCMPREMFRGHVTSYKMRGFEDGVIFAHDMERCLGKLRPYDRDLVVRVVLQEYTQEETAVMLRCSTRQLIRDLNHSLDRLTNILMEHRILKVN